MRFSVKYLLSLALAGGLVLQLSGCVFAFGNKGIGGDKDMIEKLERIDKRLDQIERELDEMEGSDKADGAELVSGAINT